MKTIKNEQLRKMLFIAICILLINACVPAGGNTPISGTFNVNLSRTNLGSSSSPGTQYPSVQKAIVVDGDSLGFLIGDKTCSPFVIFSHLLVYYKQSATNNYEFLCAEGNGIYSDQPQKGIAFLPANQTINNNTDTIYVNDYASMFNNNGNKIYWSQSIGLAEQGCVALSRQYGNNDFYNIDTLSLNRFNHVFGISRFYINNFTPGAVLVHVMLYSPVDYFIVFRKLKATGFQYYWVRCRTEQNPISGEYKFSLLNGKFQQNSITTGL